jgi:hypothetical protein
MADFDKTFTIGSITMYKVDEEDSNISLTLCSFVIAIPEVRTLKRISEPK